MLFILYIILIIEDQLVTGTREIITLRNLSFEIDSPS